jgi:predicted ribosomally synthesized peptide with SipW-like signal peptide
MALRRKLLLTLLLVGCVGSVAGFGTWSAFTATTTNTGNSYASGTVVISQHAGATTLYNASNKGPTSGSTVACVRVTYTGSLPASVELYDSGVSNGSTFNLEVERGHGLSSPDNTMNCTGFVSDHIRGRRRRQGKRRGVGAERQRRLPLHDQRQRRHHGERSHERAFDGHALVHVGGEE